MTTAATEAAATTNKKQNNDNKIKFPAQPKCKRMQELLQDCHLTIVTRVSSKHANQHDIRLSWQLPAQRTKTDYCGYYFHGVHGNFNNNA